MAKLNWRERPCESYSGTLHDEKTGQDHFGIWARNVDLENALSERDIFYNERGEVLKELSKMKSALYDLQDELARILKGENL